MRCRKRLHRATDGAQAHRGVIDALRGGALNRLMDASRENATRCQYVSDSLSNYLLKAHLSAILPANLTITHFRTQWIALTIAANATAKTMPIGPSRVPESDDR
jgi:hypothetical protein